MRLFSIGLISLCVALPAVGSSVYNESVSGDLSNVGTAPTVLTFSAGSNQVLGTTGKSTAGVIDRDYFTFTVPTGYLLSSLTVLPGTTVGGSASFLGMESGAQVTLPTNASTAAGLLGYRLYSPADIGNNILPALSVPNNGSSGFGALGAGSYSIWIQDYSTGTFTYGFDFALTQTPEPGSRLLVGLGMLVVGSGFAFGRRLLVRS